MVVDRGVAESRRHTAGPVEGSPGDVVVRRTAAGWRVEGPFPTLPTDTVDDLGLALALADLLAGGAVPGRRPARPVDGLDEVSQLRSAIRQLEHALASRVVVEQAIGVLTERWRVAPRDAFEQLRRVTRSHGLRIHELAISVVESCADPDVLLPPELVPQRPAGSGPPEPGRARTGAVEAARGGGGSGPSAASGGPAGSAVRTAAAERARAGAGRRGCRHRGTSGSRTSGSRTSGSRTSGSRTSGCRTRGSRRGVLTNGPDERLPDQSPPRQTGQPPTTLRFRSAQPAPELPAPPAARSAEPAVPAGIVPAPAHGRQARADG